MVMELCRDRLNKKAVLFHRIFISALQQWPQHWQRKFLRQAIQNESDVGFESVPKARENCKGHRASNPGTEKSVWHCFFIEQVPQAEKSNRSGYNKESPKRGILTCGKSESDDSRTFSGLRSQWTMFLACRCLRATRIW